MSALRGHAQERVASGRRLEVEHHGPLAAIDGEEPARDAALGGRNLPHVVAELRVLELDHVGAEVGEHHGEERPGQEAGQVDDPDPVERGGQWRQRRRQRRAGHRITWSPA
jgi:hypothetical protein